MLITPEQFLQAAKNISEYTTGHVGVDFETTGLKPRRGARAFIMGFTDDQGATFCVRFESDAYEGQVLIQAMRLFFSNPRLKYCAHNAKFELGFLKHQFDITLGENVWDTETMARLERNDHMKYSLQACAERIGESKYPPMLEWLKKKGNKGAYHKAPAEIIEPYVEKDAYLSWLLCQRQINQFRHWDMSPVPIRGVVRLEMQTLPHLFDMEEKGLLLDVGYCMRAREYEIKKVEDAKAEFKRLAGVPFVDSRKTLQPLFDAHGIRYGQTDKGNASFSLDAIQSSGSHPLVGAILAIRGGAKRVSTYWEKFLELEHNGLIHPTINANKAENGRMSIQDPSCQNWPTDDDEDQDDPEYPVRRAWIARPDCVIVSIDYAQMELRRMVDEAEDFPMIDAIKTGKDFHQETADMAGVARSLAKNGRFAKLYGAGVDRVASTLGVDTATAARICQAIDETSKATSKYSWGLISHAKKRGWMYNFMGRRYHFPDPKWAYLAPNYRISGGCGEILRHAICSVGEFLMTSAHPDTFMLIPIHDELLFNMHHTDLHLIPEIKRRMIEAGRMKHLPMDVSVHVGPNFFDMEKL